MKNHFLVALTTACVALGLSCAARSRAAADAQKGAAAEKRQEVPEPVEVIKGLRARFLGLKPGDPGVLEPAEGSKSYGAVMEIGFDKALASLVSLNGGDASLYLGHGGGIIGGGGIEGVSRAAKAFVAESGRHLQGMTVTKEFPYPAVGRVRFYVLTREGVYTAEAGEEELSRKGHKLSPLFYAANEVLTQLRLSTEKKQQ